jgi:hypothetical protein
MNEYTKKDETTLLVTKPVETKEETQEYKLEFLKKQELQILKDLNDYTAKRKEELAEVRTLIAEAEKLGIKETIDVEIEEEDAKMEEELTK